MCNGGMRVAVCLCGIAQTSKQQHVKLLLKKEVRGSVFDTYVVSAKACRKMGLG
jgi:hypothetical protein